MTPQNAKLMADYNRWMNERLFAASARLGEPEVAAEKGAFFGSILGTLNHIAVADTIWLHRFAHHEGAFSTLREMTAYPRPASLRELLATDLSRLRPYRERLDDLIVRLVAEFTAGHLMSNLSYESMAGVVSVKNFGALVQHFFNHQTHHRGQVSTLLFQSGVDVGPTDLVMLVPHCDL